jgi:hypothetical protein
MRVDGRGEFEGELGRGEERSGAWDAIFDHEIHCRRKVF